MKTKTKTLTPRQKQLRAAKARRRDQLMHALVAQPLAKRGPIIVNYGVGVDSTAVLVRFHQLGIVPGAIIFADTGDEKPETYEYLEYMRPVLKSWGFPDVTVLRRYEHCKRGRSRTTGQLTTYSTLKEECDEKAMLPSLAFGGHSCSIKWKADAINAYLKTQPWFRIAQALAKINERPEYLPVHVIGYDNSTADLKREHNADAQNAKSCNEHECSRFFPLQAWGWDREECVRQIADAGLVVPIKSACYYCPGSHDWELAWLGADHPSLLLKAIEMEDAWKAGRHGPAAKAARGEKTSTKGLGRSWNWRAWCEDSGVLRPDGTIDTARAEQIARATMPWTAGAAQLTIRQTEAA